MTLAHGQIAADSDIDAVNGGLRAGWQHLSLQAVGTTLTAKINGQVVATVSDSKWANGYAGLFCGWHAAHAKSFSVEAGAASIAPASQ